MVGTILYCYDGLLTSAPQICVWDIRSPQSPAAAVQNPREKGMVTRLHYNSSFAPESSTSDPPRAEGSCLSSSSSCGDDLTPQQSKDALEGHADIQTATSTCGDGTITHRGNASGLVSVSGKGLFAAGFESGEVCCYDLRMNCRYWFPALGYPICCGYSNADCMLVAGCSVRAPCTLNLSWRLPLVSALPPSWPVVLTTL
jgi:hypothetical protein